MTSRYGPKDALQIFATDTWLFLSEAFRGEDTTEAKYTNMVLLAITGFFVLELVLTTQTAASSTYHLVSYFFVNHPLVVWPVAPLLHRGFGHFFFNVAFIYIAAPVEQRLRTLRYIGMLLLAGFIPLYVDGLKLAVLGDKPHVAVYGASAFGFGLLGYGLAIHIGSDWQLTPRDWIIVVCSIASVVVVIKNVFLAVGNPVHLNFGHFLGLLVGVGFALFETQE